MYGMVNKGIEDLAVSIGGEELWQEITRRADLDVPTFVSLDGYDDAITYRLVAAASEVLGLSPATVLETFGEHWVRYTAREGYGAALSAYGTDLESFLTNLNSLHSRVQLTMPGLRPPRFVIETLGAGEFAVHYHSERVGLAPMVVGLLRGLSAMFERPISVERTADREQGADHDVFRVTLLPAGTADPDGAPALAGSAPERAEPE